MKDNDREVLLRLSATVTTDSLPADVHRAWPPASGNVKRLQQPADITRGTSSARRTDFARKTYVARATDIAVAFGR
ncbi:MAG: hypothetical protein ACUVQQ_15185 [Thermogutta sp.]